MLRHKDCHLNLFWSYGDVVYWENNVTRALINTFESMSPSEVIAFLCDCGVIPENNLTKPNIKYGLQRKPDKEIIKKFNTSNRVLWGISPTGVAWDVGKVPLDEVLNEKKDNVVLRIFEALSDNPNDKVAYKEAEKQYEEILKIQNNKGDSIPDAWIMIYDDKTPFFCVAVENKWYNLDPYQLQNHWIKSLYVNSGKTIYSKFEEIYKNISKYSASNIIVSHFLEYISLLGYEPVTSFNELDFEQSYEEPYKGILNKKFYRYFDKFMEKNYKGRYDNSKKRLYVPDINHFNIYFDFSCNSGELSISTEIGVKAAWVNEKIIPMLKNTNSLSEEISDIYGECIFVRYVRLNNKNLNLYFWINQYRHVVDYLNAIDSNRITISKLPKLECYDKLEKLGQSLDNYSMGKLRQWKPEKWHWLEYLRIINTVRISDYCYNDTCRLDRVLKQMIDRHITGLKKLDEILKS